MFCFEDFGKIMLNAGTEAGKNDMENVYIRLITKCTNLYLQNVLHFLCKLYQ